MIGKCVGCETEKDLHVITFSMEDRGNFGICYECYTIPEPRFHKTEINISRLTQIILTNNLI